jgi:predicted ATPase
VPQLLGIRIKRFRALADVSLGLYEYGVKADPLPPMVCLIGPNGSGKSTVLDALGFLADCLTEGAETACDRRGGFENLRTRGETGPIELQIYYQENARGRPIAYSVSIDEREGIPQVASEVLRQARRGTKSGRLWVFAKLEWGKGIVWSGDSTEKSEGNTKVRVELDDPRRLSITTLGQLKEHPRIVGLRSFIENWYLSYFVPEAARSLPPSGPQKHLNRTGDNLGNVVQYMQRSEPERFRKILRKISNRIPGIKNIKCVKSPDGRLLLAFNEQGYADPFFQRSMSDGTLKVFAYLLLMEDPEPRPFIGIEEPENGLYHKLLMRLAEEFKAHAEHGKTNILITTHSPYFVDALSPEQVWLIQRNDMGRAELRRAADIPKIKEFVQEGIPLGSLWYSNHFDDRVSP